MFSPFDAPQIIQKARAGQDVISPVHFVVNDFPEYDVDP
jgi:hypothetical protein